MVSDSRTRAARARRSLTLAIALALAVPEVFAQESTSRCLKAAQVEGRWVWVECDADGTDTSGQSSTLPGVARRPGDALPAGSGVSSTLRPAEPQGPITYFEGELEPGEIGVEADRLIAEKDAAIILDGDVEVRLDDQRMRADRLEYREDESLIIAEGDIKYSDDEMAVSTEQARIYTEQDRTELSDVTYEIRSSDGNGTASTAILTGDKRTQLTDVVFSTCEPDDLAWQLKASSMELNHETGRGKARNVSLKFKGVPFFYLPYAGFPIDDRRQSGFLYPSLGNSNDNGFDFSLPYYWNIASNHDATITPRLITDRGAMLQGEYRYLFNHSAGELNFEWLPDDDKSGDDRGWVRYVHRTRFSPTWRALIDLNNVSDSEYFEDFGDSLTALSRSFLLSTARLSGVGDYWRLITEVQDYQTIDDNISETREPYQRLPRVYFEGELPFMPGNTRAVLTAEAVAFDRDVGVTGNRVDLYPHLTWPIHRSSWYLEPTVGYRYTAYDLDRDTDDKPTRGTAIASMEGGLFFERTTPKGNIQTLEPRLFYLYVPFEDQTDLPAFDTSELTFGMSQLYRTNRFSGADRQADANQLSVALSSRILNGRSGNELLTASIGHIFYFRDQRVQLAGSPEESLDGSAIVAEIGVQALDRWRMDYGIQWDTEEQATDQHLVRLQYRGDDRGLLNLSYRQRRNRLEQLDASFLWPISERFRLLGRWNYSLRDEDTLEALAGLEYESCCWAVRLMGRRFVQNQEGDKRNSIYLELELKGLGSLGRGTRDILDRAILGFREYDDFQ